MQYYIVCTHKSLEAASRVTRETMPCESRPSRKFVNVLLCAEKRIHLSLLANPSHLEAVDPIVLGKVCRQTL